MGKVKVSKIFALAMILVLVFGVLSGCSAKKEATTSNGTTSSTDLLSKVIKDGKIVVTLNLANAPWGSKSATTGKYEGMAVDLIQGFADSIGVKVEFMPLEFSGLIPAIDSGKADIICTNLSRTIPRGTKVLFTEPVGASPGVAVFLKGKYSSFDEINKPDVVLTTESGSIHEEIAKKVFPNAKMQAVNQNADAITALKSGRANVFLTDMSIAEGMKQKDPNIDYLDKFTFTDSFAFAVKLSSDSYTFLEAFNNYMRIIKVNGTYSNLYTKYFNAPWKPITTEEAM